MQRLAIVAFLLVLSVSVPFAQTAAVDIVGEWDMTTLSPIGENTNTVEFRKDGDALKAFAKAPQGERPYDNMKLEGDKLTLVITVQYEGQPMVITYEGTVRDNTINGSADFGGLAQGSFSATRKPAAK